MTDTKASRKTQILQALAAMLESNPGGRITTAALAKEVGVSEAALYRHFPSKFKMFEALIEFVEATLFGQIHIIRGADNNTLDKTTQVVGLILTFAEKNPGICRILTGDAITGENEKLRQRIEQLFNRIELEIKQIFKQAELSEGVRTTITPNQSASAVTIFVDGRLVQYVRTGFATKPTENWLDIWQLTAEGLLRNPS